MNIVLIILLVGSSVFMTTLYFLGRMFRRDALVDVGWTIGMGTMVVVLAICGEGEPWRRMIFVGMVGFWSLRLGFHLFRDRIISGEEDGRYIALKQYWGDEAERKFFWFHQAQSLTIVIFACLLFPLTSNPISDFRFIDGLAMFIWLIALVGESTADVQLAKWRVVPSNKGKTCRIGLWRFSRHPNYFFEWLHWCAYPLLAIGAPLGWLTIFAPIIMLAFLYRVTGIPYAEAQALRSRGADYERYQQETSPFFPWFPKKEVSL